MNTNRNLSTRLEALEEAARPASLLFVRILAFTGGPEVLRVTGPEGRVWARKDGEDEDALCARAQADLIALRDGGQVLPTVCVLVESRRAAPDTPDEAAGDQRR